MLIVDPQVHSQIFGSMRGNGSQADGNAHALHKTLMDLKKKRAHTTPIERRETITFQSVRLKVIFFLSSVLFLLASESSW